MKIAILFIATGRYITFWENFYKKCEKYFLPGHEKTYFLFTDKEKIEIAQNVVKIYQEKCGWPYDTLMRFGTFLKAENELKNFDYIYFINANVIPIQEIGEEIFPTKEQGLTVVLHPGFYQIPRSEYEYEVNPASNAFVSPNQGQYYFMGCFNGGRADAYLKLIKDLDLAIKTDLGKNIIALWHDESHLNKYVIDKPVLILTPDYAFPEGMPFNKINLKEFEHDIKMLIKDKASPKYGGHKWLRGTTNKKRTWLRHILIRIKCNIFYTFKALMDKKKG